MQKLVWSNSKKVVALIVTCSTGALKNKKYSPEKMFPIFWEMELASSSIKKNLIFSYISGNRNPKKLPIFQKM